MSVREGEKESRDRSTTSLSQLEAGLSGLASAPSQVANWDTSCKSQRRPFDGAEAGIRRVVER